MRNKSGCFVLIETVAKAMSQLREEYGKNIPEPKCYHVTHWDKDPCSFGSWRTPTYSSTSSDICMIGDPCGSLYFAGEHIESSIRKSPT